PSPHRHPLTSHASVVLTNADEIPVNSLFPQATWGSSAVDARRLALVNTHINQLTFLDHTT
ncbi:hypothetical protein, partial [Streptomyces luteocolor]|uniref:hypothetical protein n=1 Tax=Streptomyces luteocolor TaxID=285500 RepID=UPI001EDB14DD